MAFGATTTSDWGLALTIDHLRMETKIYLQSRFVASSNDWVLQQAIDNSGTNGSP